MAKTYNEQSKEKMELLPPKNDIVFQTLFTRGRESITKAMLEDILKIKINKLDLDKSKDLLNENKEDKNGRLDLRAVINDNIECDIEIQLELHKKTKERFLYYWSKMYVANIQTGNKYEKLRKTISIIILGEEEKELKDIKEAHTKWQIREEKNLEKILTEDLELHIIELPKAIKEYKNNPKDEVLQWMMFLENPEDTEVTKIMEENKDIKEAKEELNKISMDEALRRQALNIEMARMDREQYIADAKEEGLTQGKKSKSIEIAKALLKEKIDILIISKTTGLTIEEIEKL